MSETGKDPVLRSTRTGRAAIVLGAACIGMALAWQPTPREVYTASEIVLPCPRGAFPSWGGDGVVGECARIAWDSTSFDSLKIGGSKAVFLNRESRLSREQWWRTPEPCPARSAHMEWGEENGGGRLVLMVGCDTAYTADIAPLAAQHDSVTTIRWDGDSIVSETTVPAFARLKAYTLPGGSR